MKKRYVIIPTIIFTVILVFVLWDNINTGTTSVIGFDEAYNAQVARHFAQTGKYAVTYPSEIIFYNSITTGPTMLLGTAACYKLGGVSNFTTNFIPILHGIGTLVLLYLLFAELLNTKYKYILSVFAILLYLGLPGWFELLSVCLIGEIGAMFYALLSTLLILHYFRKFNVKYLICSGFFLAFSLVTKSSQICFVIVFIAMLFLNEIVKKGRIKKLLYFILSFAAGILVWELFKLIQFGGDIFELFQWWIAEKNNLFTQTGTTGLFSNFTWAKIQERSLYLKEVFGFSYWLIILAMITPVAFFIYYYFGKKRDYCNAQMSSLLIMAFSAMSLLVYFVLFGSDGLKYARRLSVYGELVKCTLIFVFMFCIEKVFQSKFRNALAWGGIFLLILCLASEKDSLKYKWWFYTSKNAKVSEANKPIEEMANAIMRLSSDAQIYTFGWWQAPEVGLNVDYEFKDINYNICNSLYLDGNNNYFLIGGSLAPPGNWNGSCIEYLMQYYELTEIFHSPSCENNDIYLLYKISNKAESLH